MYLFLQNLQKHLLINDIAKRVHYRLKRNGRVRRLSAVAVPHQVAAVPDLMDITVGEQEDFVGDFEEGVVVVVGEDDAP